MPKTTLDTIDELLEGALNETDDSEVHYKLRNARQLLDVVKQHYRDEALPMRCITMKFSTSSATLDTLNKQAQSDGRFSGALD